MYCYKKRQIYLSCLLFLHSHRPISIQKKQKVLDMILIELSSSHPLYLLLNTSNEYTIYVVFQKEENRKRVRERETEL